MSEDLAFKKIILSLFVGFVVIVMVRYTEERITRLEQAIEMLQKRF